MANFISCVSVKSFHPQISLKIFCVLSLLYKFPPGACDQGLLIPGEMNRILIRWGRGCVG